MRHYLSLTVAILLALGLDSAAQVQFQPVQNNIGTVRMAPIQFQPLQFQNVQFQAPVNNRPNFSVVQFQARPFQQPQFFNSQFTNDQFRPVAQTGNSNATRTAPGSGALPPRAAARAVRSQASSSLDRFSRSLGSLD
jgi:hypothetical protein